MTIALRGSKVRQISKRIEQDHHQLVDELRSKGVLRLTYEDKSLAHAEFLMQLDRSVEDVRG